VDKKLKLSAPWYIYVRELRALFGQDPEINIVFDEDNLEVKFYVEDEDKADALSILLPAEKIFGAIAMRITIIPANKEKLKGTKALYDAAFKGNPVYDHSTEFQGLYNQPITYVTFKKEVVQYFSDDLGDENGVTSTLYQDIAKDVIDKDGVYFCTDVVDKSEVIKLD
jgi:hypothetical protein